AATACPHGPGRGAARRGPRRRSRPRGEGLARSARRRRRRRLGRDRRARGGLRGRDRDVHRGRHRGRDLGGVAAGRPRPAAAGDGAPVASAGPERGSVGAPATCTADVTGAETWVWSLPDGRFLLDRSTVTMTPTSAGRAELVLRSRTADGTVLETHHRFRVEE